MYGSFYSLLFTKKYKNALSFPVMSEMIILNIRFSDIFSWSKSLFQNNFIILTQKKKDMDTLKAQAPVCPWHDHFSQS